MKTNMRFCAQLERKLLNIYRRETRFKQTMYRKIQREFHVQYNFSIYYKEFDTIKQKWKNV
jgi:hypothetical protein